MADRTYWFPTKRYGWGWGAPVAWQGWVSLAVYVAALVSVAIAFPPDTRMPAFLASVAVATLALLALVWWKGEPPRWRWGGRD